MSNPRGTLTSTLLKTPVVDNNGMLTWAWQKYFLGEADAVVSDGAGLEFAGVDAGAQGSATVDALTASFLAESAGVGSAIDPASAALALETQRAAQQSAAADVLALQSAPNVQQAIPVDLLSGAPAPDLLGAVIAAVLALQSQPPAGQSIDTSAVGTTGSAPAWTGTTSKQLQIPDAAGATVTHGLLNAIAQNISGVKDFLDGIAVGALTETITEIRIITAALTGGSAPASVAANTTAEQDFTVTGLTTSHIVLVNGPAPTAGTGIVNVRVKAANTLSLTFVNATAGALTPTAGNYVLIAFKQ